MSSRTILLAAACVAATTTIDDAGAAGNVSATADNCARAHAVLMVSHPRVHGAFPHPDYGEAIKRVVDWNKHWTVLPEMEPMVSQKLALKMWDFRNGEGTAYVAHCGHGATCNEVARTVLKAYPELGSPMVTCGEIPSFLDNPRPM